MLLRLGRIVYLCILALLVLVWTGARNDDTRKVVHKGWDVTAHAFGQGSSFAMDDVVVSNSEKVLTNVDKSKAVVREQERKTHRGMNGKSEKSSYRRRCVPNL
jgi:hypothetical protein